MFADDESRVRHMLDAAAKIEELVRGNQRSDLDRSWVVAFAFIKAIEVFGEAASKTSRNYRAAHPEIEWRVIVDLRNHLIHDYLDFDLDRAWTFASVELPPITEAIRKLVSEAESE